MYYTVKRFEEYDLCAIIQYRMDLNVGRIPSSQLTIR